VTDKRNLPIAASFFALVEKNTKQEEKSKKKKQNSK
jgi:hypothetical protein